MARLKVVMAPVGLMPVGDTQLRAVVYKPQDGWLETTVTTGDPAVAARGLLSGAPGTVDSTPAPLEAAGFIADSTETRLIYTAPLPLSTPLAVDAEESDPEWPLLAPWGEGRSIDSLEIVHATVLRHWHHQVAETTAALDLLPVYFTTTQVRAVYSSLWGRARDWSNFHRWLHKSNGEICEDVPPKLVAERVDRRLDAALRSTDVANRAGTSAIKLAAAIDASKSAGLVGMSPGAIGALSVALPPVAIAAAIAGGTIAYQRSVTRGKAPTWFTRAAPERRVLPEAYSPRPEWLGANQTAPR